MYVCICKAVTEKDLEDTIAEGADSLLTIQEKCEAGRGCGCCLEKILVRLKQDPHNAPKKD
jgi:bacterioferritin-associated ferredoxin